MPLRLGELSLRLLKIRANVLDRHKRLYLVCIGENCTLFILPVASIGNHNKGARTIEAVRQ